MMIAHEMAATIQRLNYTDHEPERLALVARLRARKAAEP